MPHKLHSVKSHLAAPLSTRQRGRASAARPLPRSIFLGQHDRENPRCLCRVGGVFGAILTNGVIVVDFPENALGLVVEAPEIMLPVRVVALGEGVECPHLFKDRVAVVAVESKDSVGDVTPSICRKVAAEAVVKLTNFRGVVGRRHGSFLLLGFGLRLLMQPWLRRE